jgi:uncharacterized membrane protein
VIALLLILGCGDGSEGEDTSTTVPTGACHDAPVLTWENFGQGFVLEHCQSCHAAAAPYRSQTDNPPPETVTFDTHEQTVALRTLILATAAGETPSMPPRGGVAEIDIDKLDIWLNCWEGE